jgi:hypothetical protein
LGCLLYLGVATLYYVVIMVVTFKRLPKGNAGVGFSEIAFSRRLRVLLLYTLLSGLGTAGIVSAVRTFRHSWLAVPVLCPSYAALSSRTSRMFGTQSLEVADSSIVGNDANRLRTLGRKSS